MTASGPQDASDSDVGTGPARSNAEASLPGVATRADATRIERTPGVDPAATASFDIRESTSNDAADATIDLTSERRDSGPSAGEVADRQDETLHDGRRAQPGWHAEGLLDYELISEIARGGMGVVYRARQRSLNRVVAVKMILAGQLACDEDVRRFRTEAEAAANLQHPNIVAIYEVGQTGGRHFFSMQFVEGQSLAQLIREKSMAPQAAVTCLRTVADAVEYAHGHGVLHRDLKPSNILVDAAGQPHLTDFGVAKRLRDDSQLTVTGTIVGTPSYMPPEQAVGDKDIDCTADVYSLGAVLYELLTGRPPFTAQKPTDILMQVLHSEPVSPRVLNPSVPADLATICAKCLEKEPSRRYSSAGALSADLVRWLGGVPIEARPIGRVERAWRWCKRSPVVAGMSALLVLVAIGAFVGVTSQWLVAQSALRRMQEAQAQRVTAQVEGLLKAAPESLTVVLNQLKPQYDDIAPELRRLVDARDLSDHDRLRLSLALLPGDPSQVDYLRNRMLSIELTELLAVRESLGPYRDRLQEDLWKVLDDEHASPDARFSAALILAHGENEESPRDDKWQAQAPFLAARLLNSVGADPSSYERLVAALRPIRRSLLPALTQIFADPRQSQSVRTFATSILVNFAADQPAKLASLLLDAEPWQFPVIRPRLAPTMSGAIELLLSQLDEPAARLGSDSEKDKAGRRRAVAAIALLQLGLSDRLWPLLVHRDDPRVRSHLIELFQLSNTDPGLLIARLNEETEVSARRAILLALGNYDADAIPDDLRRSAVEHCVALHSTDPDSGIRSACQWLLRRWKVASPPLATGALPAAGPASDTPWILGPEDHTLAVIDGRGEATIGSPATEERRSIAERRHSIRIGRKFALATKEVSIEQFRRFSQATGLKMPPFTRQHSPDDGGPIIMVTWFRAAQYCRWLSEQAGVPEDQMCYPPIDKISEGLQLGADYLERTGYRLPTEAEWEFGCRAGAATSRSFGSSDDLLGNYAWYASNANGRAWPCGTSKPNDFGLFDMHGNAWEWCGDRWTSFWEHPRDHDAADLSPVSAASNRVLRGGSFDSAAKIVRSAFRDRFEKPTFASDEIGFRIARTMPE